MNTRNRRRPLRPGPTATAALVALALALGASPPARADDLTQARSALERRDFAAALPVYERLLVLRPDDVDLWIEAARASGFADRNAEAAARYRRALELAPPRRADMLPALAWQTLWAGDAAGAAPLFEEVARSGADPAARADALDGLGQARDALGQADAAILAWQASLGLRPAQAAVGRRLARALLWRDRHAEADALLTQALARDPADRDSAWLRASVWNFAGRHQDAVREFERLGGPRGAGERLDAARAWAWAGVDERALALLADTADADARWWRDHRLQRELRPYAWGRVEHSTDADRLDTSSLVLGYGWQPQPAARVDIQARRVSLDEPGATRSATELQWRWRQRYGQPGAPGGLWWPSLSLRATDWGDWTPLAGQAALAWLPRDGWRVDAELGRESVETTRAVAERVQVDTLALGLDHRPHPRLTLTAGLAALRFDDGNRRQRATARAQWLLAGQPRWVLGAEALAFHSERPSGAGVPARGYWNPARYREARAYTMVEVERRPWDFSARLGLGAAVEVDGDGLRSHGQPQQWALAVGRDLGPQARLQLGVAGAGAGMGLSGGSGYWRRGATLSLHAWF